MQQDSLSSTVPIDFPVIDLYRDYANTSSRVFNVIFYNIYTELDEILFQTEWLSSKQSILF